LLRLVRPKSQIKRQIGANNNEKNILSWSKSSTSRTLFRPDLYRVRLWQGQETPRAGLGVDELLPALRFAAGVAVQDYVKNAL
jgi:hypothetical protein